MEVPELDEAAAACASGPDAAAQPGSPDLAPPDAPVRAAPAQERTSMPGAEYDDDDDMLEMEEMPFVDEVQDLIEGEGTDDGMAALISKLEGEGADDGMAALINPDDDAAASSGSDADGDRARAGGQSDSGQSSDGGEGGGGEGGGGLGGADEDPAAYYAHLREMLMMRGFEPKGDGPPCAPVLSSLDLAGVARCVLYILCAVDIPSITDRRSPSLTEVSQCTRPRPRGRYRPHP